MSYSYPTAQGQQQQQRTGPIIVGANKATTTITAPKPAGRYASQSISILRSYASSSLENNGKKRKAGHDCVDDLARLAPPLFLCANNSIGADNDSTQDGSGNSFKKRKGGIGDKSDYDDDEQADNGTHDNRRSKIEYRKQLQNQLKQNKQQNQYLMKRRENVFKSFVAIHELYETGLDAIARMNDLRFVPDNVMPDKIPDS